MIRAIVVFRTRLHEFPYSTAQLVQATADLCSGSVWATLNGNGNRIARAAACTVDPRSDLDAFGRRSIWRHHLNKSRRSIHNRPSRRNRLIYVVHVRRGAVYVGVLGIVAETTHPVEFADFCLSRWLKLSDRGLQQNGVRTFTAGLEALVDQQRGKREARGIVGERKCASRVKITEGGGCGEVDTRLGEVAFGEVAVGCDASEAALLDELIDLGTSSFPAIDHERVSWRSRCMSGRSARVRRNGSASAAPQAAALTMRGLTSRARAAPAMRDAS